MAAVPHPQAPPPSPEFRSIERWIEGALTTADHVIQGPGDDVAWLRADGPLALSVDAVVEGVHFRRAWLSDQEVGRRALAAALSDLAAARAEPLGCLVSLCLPPAEFDRGDGVMAGVAEGAARWGCPILGGDTVGGERLALSISVVGRGRPLGRSGASPGDLVQLSGSLGHAAAAVAAWERQEAPDELARRAFADPEPRLDLRDALAEATATIDVSDGLLADAGHLARRSSCALELDRVACGTPGRAEALALSGGEDYQLLACAPSPLPGFRVIGRALPGAGLRFSDGSPLPSRLGWDHGRSR